ncbi:MAG: transketolase C-terminal domain-containing protein [bacterium]
MRIAFVNTLLKLAKKDKRIILITGDLGFSVFEDCIKEFPKQYLNAGVAEQNMTGMAAGMAMEGKIPLLYSIVPFVTMRNFEQIRNDICYQNLNVKIVGVGSGFSYGIYGHTHYGLEDIGILRTIPNITILSPGDPVETELATRAAFTINGPVYIRLGKAGEPTVHKIKPVFTVGKGIIVKKGRDIALLSTGTMVPVAVEVAELLKNKYSVCVVSMHTIKPLDEILVKELARKMRGIFTLEEHTIIGGLGGAVAEILAENNSKNVFRRFGSPDQFNKLFGSQQYMREKNGLSATCIVKEIQRIVK